MTEYTRRDLERLIGWYLRLDLELGEMTDLDTELLVRLRERLEAMP